MIKTLFDIDYLAQYEPYHISRKRGKVREMEYKRKVDKKRIPTCNIMGVNIAAINMEWLVDYLEKNISEIKGDYICVSNVHTTVPVCNNQFIMCKLLKIVLNILL